MVAELRDGWTAEDLARGEAVLTGWSDDQRANSFADSFRGLLAMQANADSVFAAVDPESTTLRPFTLGTFSGQARDDFAKFKDAAPATPERSIRNHAACYLANTRAMRMLSNDWRRVSGATPTLTLPTLPAGIPLVVAGAVVGVAAVAGVTWWGIDKNKREAEVSKAAAVAAAEAQMYIARVKAAVDTQSPIPEPPDLVGKLANAEASGGIWLLGAGAGIGALAVGAAMFARREPRYQMVRSNPSPPSRRRAPRRTAPRKLTRRNPRRRKLSERMTPKRKQVMSIAYSAWQSGARSSAGSGSSKLKGSASFINAAERRTAEDLAKIGWLKIVERGKWRGMTEIFARITPKGREALGKSWGAKLNPSGAGRRRKKVKRKVNPLRQGYSRATVQKNVAEMKRKGYPEAQAVAAALRSARAAYRKKHPRGGFPAHLQTASERKGHKRAGKKARKKNPSIVVSVRKKNPKRRKPEAPPKGDTPRAKWIRAQMKKGRSKKQAAALWKGQQAMKRKRRAAKKVKRKRNPKGRAGAS